MAMFFVQESEKENAQRGRVHTLTWRRNRYGDNGGEISIDGVGEQLQEGAGDDKDDPETKGRQSWEARMKSLQ